MKSKLSSLSKNEDFKSLLGGKKVSNKYLTIFFKKLSGKNNKKLNISFVAKKKIGNAVKRNKIKRKLKAIVQKILKIKGAINRDYTYIVFGKTKSFSEDHKKIVNEMTKSFKKIN